MVLAVLGVCAFACKKSDSTPAVTIGGNWTFVNEIGIVYFDGLNVETDTIPASSGDYFNFSSNGMLYSQVTGEKDTSTYSQTGNNLIVTSSGIIDTFAIATLAQHNCSLFYKSPTVDTTINSVTGTFYESVNINLSR